MHRCKAFAAAAGLTIGALPGVALAQSPAPACPSPAPKAVQRSVLAVRIGGTATTLQLRIADDYAKREYGLMCVRTLEPRSGMIFVFADGERSREFWMKNTLVPLDMLFVAKSGRVDSVAANVPATQTDTADEKIPRRSGTGAYVIELAAGEAAHDGIAAGTMLRLGHLPRAKE